MEKNLQPLPQVPKIDVNRRRLTKAGLATPAVMGLLASKQVLGDTPYQCTISGQISGNNSLNGPATDDPCSSGVSYDVWKATISDANNTPGSKTLPELNTEFSDAFYTDKIQSTKHLIGNPNSSNSSAKQATLYEILNVTLFGSPQPPELEYARKALLLWHNAHTLNPSGGTYNKYPLSEADAVRLFNALVTHKPFTGTTSLGSFSWDQTSIERYITLLFR